MFDSLFLDIRDFFVNIVETGGYEGVFLATVIEGTFLPLPLEEVVIPFAGKLVADGVFELWAVTFVGGLGTTIGAGAIYLLSYHLGLPFLTKYGKYFFISEKEIKKGQDLFNKYGGRWFILVSRVIPGIRGIVPIAAGLAKTNFVEFCFFTFLGSCVYIFALAYVGMELGDRWEEVESYVQYSDYVVIAGVLLLLLFIVYKLKRKKSLREMIIRILFSVRNIKKLKRKK